MTAGEWYTTLSDWETPGKIFPVVVISKNMRQRLDAL